jgi:hypothetical protein
MRLAAPVRVGAYDVALRVDPRRFRNPRCARHIDFCELWFVRKVPSIVGATGSRDPCHE